MVSTNTQGLLLLQNLSIIRRRSKEGDFKGVGFLSLGLFFLEAVQSMPYYDFSILEQASIRVIRTTPHQEVAV
jgi:hypothetical protein